MNWADSIGNYEIHVNLGGEGEESTGRDRLGHLIKLLILVIFILFLCKTNLRRIVCEDSNVLNSAVTGSYDEIF
jgi:hypothetical protein